MGCDNPYRETNLNIEGKRKHELYRTEQKNFSNI